MEVIKIYLQYYNTINNSMQWDLYKLYYWLIAINSPSHN